MRYPIDPTETMWLIGQEWKCSNAWSGLILIGRKFDQGSVEDREKSEGSKYLCSYSVLKVWSRGGGESGRASLKRRRETEESGDNDREAPPVPMPNTEVKLSDADDSQLATARENMSLPGTNKAPK